MSSINSIVFATARDYEESGVTRHARREGRDGRAIRPQSNLFRAAGGF